MTMMMMMTTTTWQRRFEDNDLTWHQQQQLDDKDDNNNGLMTTTTTTTWWWQRHDNDNNLTMTTTWQWRLEEQLDDEDNDMTTTTNTTFNWWQSITNTWKRMIRYLVVTAPLLRISWLETHTAIHTWEYFVNDHRIVRIMPTKVASMISWASLEMVLMSLKILEPPFEFLCRHYEFHPIFFSPAISKVPTPNHDVHRF